MNIFFRSLIIAALAILSGCGTSGPLASQDQDAASKTFAPPAANMAGIYIYRNSPIDEKIPKRLLIDGVLIGETVNKVFFHKEVTPGVHTLTTQGEFLDNSVQISVRPGRNYFFEQSIKIGTFKGNPVIKSVSEAEGKQNVLQCSEGRLAGQ
jgi:predicted small lipoprotein YifL